jgi:hypothetical protein
VVRLRLPRFARWRFFRFEVFAVDSSCFGFSLAELFAAADEVGDKYLEPVEVAARAAALAAEAAEAAEVAALVAASSAD